MENKETYNGWANYATWKVALELFDGTDAKTFTDDIVDAYDLSKIIEAWVEEHLEQNNKLALDYALAFVANVNFYEIAKVLIEDTEV